MSGIPSVDELVAALIDSWNDGDAKRFASPGLHVRNFRVLPGIGSDHLPISAEVSLR